jgi:hypothetical protein
VLDRRLIGAFALAASLGLMCDAAPAHDESKFPDWSGQWFRTYGGNPRYDQSKPIRKQDAPLKPEYQARFEASVIEGQAHVTIGKEVYFRSADGTIMPMKKDQPPPDLKYFKRAQD